MLMCLHVIYILVIFQINILNSLDATNIFVFQL